jgi:hypothetical protein
MRVPMVLRDSVNPYLAARAVFLLVQQGQLPIRSVAFPGLGTGVGGIGPKHLRPSIPGRFRGGHARTMAGPANLGGSQPTAPEPLHRSARPPPASLNLNPAVQPHSAASAPSVSNFQLWRSSHPSGENAASSIHGPKSGSSRHSAGHAAVCQQFPTAAQFTLLVRTPSPASPKLNPASQPHSARHSPCYQQFPGAAQLTLLVRTAVFTSG